MCRPNSLGRLRQLSPGIQVQPRLHSETSPQILKWYKPIVKHCSIGIKTTWTSGQESRNKTKHSQMMFNTRTKSTQGEDLSKKWCWEATVFSYMVTSNIHTQVRVHAVQNTPFLLLLGPNSICRACFFSYLQWNLLLKKITLGTQISTCKRNKMDPCTPQPKVSSVSTIPK